MANQTIIPILAAIIGGFIPTLVWLTYWLHQDINHPQPKKILFLTFLLGVFIVAFVVPLQRFVIGAHLFQLQEIGLNAFIEEFFKLMIPLLIIFPSHYLDETCDYTVYLVTVALGFAGVENALFLFTPLHALNYSLAVSVGNLRFVGSTVLHALLAVILGTIIGNYHNRPLWVRLVAIVVGLLTVTLLHTLFNYSILSGTILYVLISIIVLWGLMLLVSNFYGKLVQKQEFVHHQK